MSRSIPALTPISGDKYILFFLIQGGHPSYGKLPLDKKEEIREVALSAPALSQVCSAQSNQHTKDLDHFGWHDLNFLTSINQEFLYLAAKPPCSFLSDWVGIFVRLQLGMKILLDGEHMHLSFQ